MGSINDISELELAPEYCVCKVEKAAFWCGDCNKNYCSKCCDDVHENRAFFDHQMINIRDKPFSLIQCDEHIDTTIEYWCPECKKLACVECRMYDDDKHKHVGTAEAANDVSAKLKDEIEQIQLMLDRSIQHAEQMIGTTEEVNIGAVTEIFASLRKRLDEQENRLKERILEVETNNNRLIETYQTQLRAKEQSLHQQNRYLESMISANKHVKLLKVQDQLTTKLNKISAELHELNVPIKTEYQVKGVDQLPTAVDGLLNQTLIAIEVPDSHTLPPNPIPCGGEANADLFTIQCLFR